MQPTNTVPHDNIQVNHPWHTPYRDPVGDARGAMLYLRAMWEEYQATGSPIAWAELDAEIERLHRRDMEADAAQHTPRQEEL